MLERVPLAGHTVIADKGFAGAEFEGWMADRGANFLRPDRKDEAARFGSLGRIRQWIESVFWTDFGDVIVGLDGKDKINAGKGKDLVCGGNGKDILNGGKGNDRLYGEAGKDKLVGGKGKDKCVGAKGRDSGKGCEKGKL